MLRAYLRLIRFDKPIGTLLLLWPTLWALWLAYPGVPPLGVIFTFCAGVFLTRSAGCAINDFADSDFDGKVKRTSNRPLVTGEITKKQALAITVLLSIMAFILAATFLKGITLLWAIPALFIFMSYPFFKRFFPIPQMYLAIAFSFGIPMVFVEAQGQVTFLALLIFAANFFLVLSYDTIYALVDIDDDLTIGIKTSAITFGNYVIHIIMLSYAMFIFFALWIGIYAKLHWVYYAVILIEIYLIKIIYGKIKDKDRQKCFEAFLYNNRLGWVLFLAILITHRL